MGDDNVVEPIVGHDRAGVSQTCSDIFRQQARVIFENGLVGFTLGQQAQDEFHRDTHTSNDWLPAEDGRIAGDPDE